MSITHSRESHAGHRALKLIAAAVLLLTASHPALASRATQRCTALDTQLQAALKSHPGSRATRAAALGVQARKLCSTARPALGLRTYIKAFRELGLEPELPKE